MKTSQAVGRSVRSSPGRTVRASWLVGTLAGALALAPSPFAGRTPDGLTPRTLSAALAAVVPAGATDPRVSGVYGSGHRGSWQFIAFLTWRTPGGQVAGGSTDLPALGTSAPVDLELDAAKLDLEHSRGYPLQTLDEQLARLDTDRAALALVELETPDGAEATLTACRSVDPTPTNDTDPPADVLEPAGSLSLPGRCQTLTRDGTLRASDATLVDTPGSQPPALAVRRG